MTQLKGFVGLSYHYIKFDGSDKSKRILGTSPVDFCAHINMLKSKYKVVSLEDAHAYLYSNIIDLFPTNIGALMTFDDGLSSHFNASKILSENNIRAVFFVPTCVLKDRLPINPVIIHYGLAIFGIERFLSIYNKALKEYGLYRKDYLINYVKGKIDPWSVIREIKRTVKYKLNYKSARRVLLYVYKNLLKKEYPNIMDDMHLNSDQIKQMIKMGHSIGGHTYSHISVKAANLSEGEFNIEMIEPKKYLEEEYNISVNSFAYPFGYDRDSMSVKDFMERGDIYNMVFTIEPHINTKKTSPFYLGRYEVYSGDNSQILEEKIDLIIKKEYEDSDFNKQRNKT